MNTILQISSFALSTAFTILIVLTPEISESIKAIGVLLFSFHVIVINEYFKD